MRKYEQFFIGGKWVDPSGSDTIEVVNPATEEVAGTIAAGTSADVDEAVVAARLAFAEWSRTSIETRIYYFDKLLAEYEKRADDLAKAVTEEMGAPADLSSNMQVAIGAAHLTKAKELLAEYSFTEQRGPTQIVHEPIGVCGLITPWNWPLNQITCKFAPAMAVGNTVVLKPSELSPFCAVIFAEIVEAAGLPSGVLNLINGYGPAVGTAMASHPDIDMISITGSTRAGISVAETAAKTVKRVHQELGGKSPNILLDDDTFPDAVTRGVAAVMMNSGQTCSAPTRMLVPARRMAEASEIAKAAAEAVVVGDPTTAVAMGPVVSGTQWTKVQDLIGRGIAEGAVLVTGGTGRPDGLEKGFFVKPTIFADVDNSMTIAREEIFGPVLSILGYASVDEAVAIANDTEYGLAANVNGADLDAVRAIAMRLRAGQVIINDPAIDFNAPFGGYKRSGNGREWGIDAFGEFLETKAVLGFEPATS